MTDMGRTEAFWTAPVRSSLSELAGAGIEIVRPCQFSFPGKILTPVDDLLVPLVADSALDDLLGRSGIAGVLTTRALAEHIPERMGLAIADDPMRAHHEIHLALSRIPGRLWRDFPSEIDPQASIHPTAWVAPRNVRIGAGVAVLPHAVVHERSAIEEGSRIHSQAVVGGDAYEIVMIEGRQVLRPQTGGVLIGRNCEIMTGAIVTRSAFCGATVIGDNSVLDCNVTISHDCRIADDVRIGGSSWIGGRVTIGAKASLGPNCTIGNGLTIGSAAKISLGAVVTKDVCDGEHVSGNFAIKHERLLDHLRRIR